MTETFLLHEFRLFAPARVGQSAGYAHVDTGARQSSVLQSYSGPFEQIGAREMHAAFGTTSLPQVRLDEVAFLGKTFQAVPAYVLPDHVGGFDALPFTVVLVLGHDVLLQYPLYLDFPKSTLSFLEVGPPEKATQVRVEADFHWGPPLFKMGLGEQPLNAVFDTGAAMSVFNQVSLDRFRNEIIEDEPVEADDPTGAKLNIPTFKCRTLKLGEYALDECRFLAIDMSAIEQEAGLQVDFVLGINGMMGKSWVVDRQRSCIEMI